MKKLGLVLALAGCSSTSVSYYRAPDAGASSDARPDIRADAEPKSDARASTDGAIAAGGSGGLPSFDSGVGGAEAGGTTGTGGSAGLSGPLDASLDTVSDRDPPDVRQDAGPPVVCVSCPASCPTPNGFDPACGSLPFEAFPALPGCNLAACVGVCNFSGCCTLAGHCGP